MPSLSFAGSAQTHARKAAPQQTRTSNSRVNFLLVIVVALLVACGLLTVYSVTLTDSDYSIVRQALGVGLGCIIAALLWLFDYRRFEQWVVPLLIFDVFLILMPMIPGLGQEVNGATSWVKLGSLPAFQPSEFAKPVTIVMVASAAAKYEGSIVRGTDFLKLLVMIFIPFILLASEDFGTALVILIVGFCILFIAGAARKWLILTLVVVVAGAVGILGLNGVVSEWTGGSVQLIKSYQMSRLLVFIDQDNPDYADDAYNLNQAKIAVGSGELFGKGWGNATQSSGGFLPESATDFIFCVFAEQFGFAGCFLLLALYLALLAVALNIGFKSSDLFGSLMVAGIMGMWLIQILENIGMDLGLMPITGIPLPFMSYGSSFMITNFMCVGLLLSVWARRGSVQTR